MGMFWEEGCPSFCLSQVPNFHFSDGDPGIQTGEGTSPRGLGCHGNCSTHPDSLFQSRYPPDGALTLAIGNLAMRTLVSCVAIGNCFDQGSPLPSPPSLPVTFWCGYTKACHFVCIWDHSKGPDQVLNSSRGQLTGLGCNFITGQLLLCPLSLSLSSPPGRCLSGESALLWHRAPAPHLGP